MSLDRTERWALADLLIQVGPQAPTLCAGWDAADLAVHLVLRDGRPDAMAASFVPGLKGLADQVGRGYRRWPWPRLVEAVRSGPPRWSPTALPAVGRAVNSVEMFVHHEDVRRAQPGWTARELPDAASEALWSQLRRQARLLYRHVPVGVLLRRPDGVVWRARTVEGAGSVTVTGRSEELLLHAFGRREVAQVEVTGEPSAVEAVAGARLGI